MIRLERKLYYERTQEMIETSENIRKLKGKVKEGAKKLGSKISHPVRTGREIGESVSGTYKKYKDDPGKLKTDASDKAKKAWKFMKKNPEDAVILGAGYTAVPYATNKIVSRFKGPKAGLAMGAMAAALPLGELGVGLKHALVSKEGKTALKATGQRIKGVASDIKKKVTRRGNKDTN